VECPLHRLFAAFPLPFPGGFRVPPHCRVTTRAAKQISAVMVLTPIGHTALV